MLSPNPMSQKNSTYILKTLRVFPEKFLSRSKSLLNPISYLLIKSKINPNTLSTLALITGLGAGVLFFFRHPLWAGILIVICGILDVLDGKVAEETHQKSLYGAHLDSTLDRYSEFFIYLGIAYYFKDHWAVWITFWTILGSFAVSYTRAKAESLGIECKIGSMQRGERMISLSAAAIIGPLLKIFDPFMIVVLILIAVVSNITVIQRILYVRKAEKLIKKGD
jgi:phosphatidylglycerophosphate synthase